MAKFKVNLEQDRYAELPVCDSYKNNYLLNKIGMPSYLSVTRIRTIVF